jgi:hypothetical protein
MDLETVARVLRALLPWLDEQVCAERRQVHVLLRSAVLMALGAVEDELGVERTVISRRALRHERHVSSSVPENGEWIR